MTIELRKKSSSLSSLNVRMIFEALAAYNPGFEGSEQQVSNRYIISYNHHYTIFTTVIIMNCILPIIINHFYCNYYYYQYYQNDYHYHNCHI
jgi:hypothetical protein